MDTNVLSTPSLEGLGKVTIVKVGGAIVEDEEQLALLIDNFSKIEGPKVLVHGGGRRATKVAASLGIESHMVGGRRITDADMLSVVTMVYGGLVNKHLVAMLQARGVNAIGMTGADMDIIRSHKRPLKKMVVDGEEEMVDFGFVGDVDRVDGKALSLLLEQGVVPVIAPLTHDGEGNILNTNADTMASEVAKALANGTNGEWKMENGEYASSQQPSPNIQQPSSNVTLIYSFEKKGVLSNPDDDDSVIPEITHESFERYKADGTISGGMLPKIENALAAVDAGVTKVIITLATAIDGRHGTVIKDKTSHPLP